jgi:hypothetical protein
LNIIAKSNLIVSGPDCQVFEALIEPGVVVEGNKALHPHAPRDQVYQVTGTDTQFAGVPVSLLFN